MIVLKKARIKQQISITRHRMCGNFREIFAPHSTMCNPRASLELATGTLTGKDACCLTVSGKKTQHVSKVDFILKNTVPTTRIPLDEYDTYLQTKGPTGFSS